MDTVEHIARQAGPVTLHLKSLAADIQVACDPSIRYAQVQLEAVNGDTNAVKAIEQARFSESSGEVSLVLDEMSVAGGSRRGIQFGRGNVQVNSFGNYSMSMMNGVEIGPIVVRALLPAGSALVADSTSGSVIARGVGQVEAETVSGSITAEGVTQQTRLGSVSGSIVVTSTTGRPSVRAKTVSGNVYGQGVSLRGSSVSGSVTAA